MRRRKCKVILFPQENEVPCLNCQVRYGKRPGEARNHGLVTVRSSVTVIAIHSLSAVDMELTADLHLYQVHSHTSLYASWARFMSKVDTGVLVQLLKGSWALVGAYFEQPERN